MDENEITQRLRDAGDRPIPGAVRATHLTRMHAATPVAEGPTRFGRFAVAAAAFVGFVVGSTGFAMAGALPDPAQRVAHDVLSVVQLEVDDPKANHGRCVSEAMKAMDPTASEEARKAAKDAACPKAKGKPAGVGGGKPAHAGTPGGPKGARPEWGECQGPPAWAGKKTAGEKQAAKAQRAACREADVEADEQQAPDLEAPSEAEGGDDQAPGAEQRPADPGGQAPVETPPGPPAEGAPGQRDGATPPPVAVPTPDEPTTEDAG